MKAMTSLLCVLFTLSLVTSVNAQPISDLSDQQVQTKIDKYKGMRTTGIVLTSIGIPTLAAGIGLYVAGLLDSDESTDYYGNSTTDIDGKVWAGLGLMVVGELALGGGIVLWAIGGNKVKKYTYEQKRRQQSLHIQSSKNGIGIAYRF